MARPGRRPGQAGTREKILGSARAEFAEHGFDRATLRAIAQGAGVDAAMVHHYFGNKEGLFMAALELPIEPEQMVNEITEGELEEVPYRLVRSFLAVWDHPVAGPAAVAVLRSALHGPLGARLVRDFLTTQILRRVAARLPLDRQEAPLRFSLCASQLVGLAVARYILKLQPLASAPAERVAAAISPSLQRYLLGPLDSGEP
jgi:AcrR family transcriptional regulator